MKLLRWWPLVGHRAGYERPRWWGVVYVSEARLAVRLAPIPLNVVFRLVYLAHGWIVYPFKGARWWERWYRQARSGPVVIPEDFNHEG